MYSYSIYNIYIHIIYIYNLHYKPTPYIIWGSSVQTSTAKSRPPEPFHINLSGFGHVLWRGEGTTNHGKKHINNTRTSYIWKKKTSNIKHHQTHLVGRSPNDQQKRLFKSRPKRDAPRPHRLLRVQIFGTAPGRLAPTIWGYLLLIHNQLMDIEGITWNNHGKKRTALYGAWFQLVTAKISARNSTSFRCQNVFSPLSAFGVFQIV
jgi:hypothetical protein